jgi:hypothetical protein
VQRTLVDFICFVTGQPPLLSMAARELVAIDMATSTQRKRAKAAN